jgi:cleavage stimulation factor subunit 3
VDKQCWEAQRGHVYPKGGDGSQSIKVSLDLMSLDNSSSFLLTYTYAKAQEIKKKFVGVHATYDKFLALLRSQLETLEQTTTSTGTSSSAVVPNGSGNSAATIEAGIQSASSSFNTQASDEKPTKDTELQRLRTEYRVAYIVCMRFGRRSEGIKSLCGIFGKARRNR